MDTNAAVGDVRPSQIITSYGPGALVDLKTISIIVAGIDDWPKDPGHFISEPRLQRALRVDGFYSAKPSEGSFHRKIGTVPAYLFPRFQFCPISKCRNLSVIGDGDLEYDPKSRQLLCKAPGCTGIFGGKRRAPTVPAPFVVACQGGHIDDFPWRTYVHRGPTTCKGRLKLFSIGKTGSVADIWVSCECEAKRSVSNAFGEHRSQALGQCTGRRPWLRPSHYDSTPCSHELKALLHGATNAWFPVVRSAIAVEEDAIPVGRALASCDQNQLSKVDSLKTLEAFLAFEDRLAGFDLDEIWKCLIKRRSRSNLEEADLQWPEWQALRKPCSSTRDYDEFFLEPSVVPYGFQRHLLGVTRVRKLLEVRALLGFTRLEPPSSTPDDDGRPTIASLSQGRGSWLPAVEVRGEGIFIEFLEEAVTAWAEKEPVKERQNAMAEKYTEWLRDRGARDALFPGARYLLLHSFAHALIRQVGLDCGYSQSSIRERVYSSSEPGREMAGILLYTASPDSEGSLGGLVDLAAPDRFPDLLIRAIRSTEACSSDPLCADHEPDAHASINGSACHACLLVSETSCENFNRFLDRSVICGTIANRDLAYFPNAIPSSALEG